MSATNRFYKKALDQVANEVLSTAGRKAGNFLLNRLTESKSDEPQAYADLLDGDPEYQMKPGQSMKDFREKATEGLKPKFTREDLPEGFGVQTLLGGVVENPIDSAISAKNIAPYAGLAAAGTALNFIFGGKPRSEYRVPVSPTTGYGNALGMNQNVVSSNVSTMNAEYIENLKYQHQLDLIKAKAEARTPGVQMSDPSGRPALNEEVKEVARMLYGTGLKL